MCRRGTQDQGDKFKAVSQDVWTQLLEFIETVGDDLGGWSEMDACGSTLDFSFFLGRFGLLGKEANQEISIGPSTIDQFVEWKQAKDGVSTA